MELKSRNIFTTNDSELDIRPNTDVFLLSHYFKLEEKVSEDFIDLNDIEIKNRLQNTFSILSTAFESLKDGGLIFVYSIPKWLPFIGEFLNQLQNNTSKMQFKYWIAIDIDSQKRIPSSLNPSQHGVLMYLKTRQKSQSPFNLNTKEIRIPYEMCKACNQNLRDWGGKKHLINPIGANISDVWKDLPRREIKDNIIPTEILNRIYDMTEISNNAFNFVHCIESNSSRLNNNTFDFSLMKSRLYYNENTIEFSGDLINNIVQGDCVEILKQVAKKYPEGIFDIAFADPPYNLSKDYDNYEDEKKDELYLEWCDEWLYWMYKCLKPGGALFVLNLPKWAITHAVKLSQYMIFKNWIVWDAMSTPAGKIMPAHYAMPYFIKPNGKSKFNYRDSSNPFLNKSKTLIGPIDAPFYCLRQSCVKARKKRNEDKKVDLTDIWWDIPRIKHKKYRNGEHPCQLPFTLLERIIKLFSNENDLIMDPFGGIGTTAIVAKMINRKFFAMDIDPLYVQISFENLNTLQPTLQKGYYEFPRKSITIKRESNISQKEIEENYINLCRDQNKIFNKEELSLIDHSLFEKIESKNADMKTLMKMANRRMNF